MTYQCSNLLVICKQIVMYSIKEKWFVLFLNNILVSPSAKLHKNYKIKSDYVENPPIRFRY
jgi:hypothetical protein